MKKICLILPSLSGGGMERVMSELAIFFTKTKKANVYLILLGKSKHFYTLPDAVFVYEPTFQKGKENRFFYTIQIMLFLRKTVNRIQPHAILSFGEMYNSLVLLATCFSSYKVFVSDRSKPDKYWGRLQEWLRKVSYKRAYGIIAQTQVAKDIMFKRIRHKNIKVIGNPIRSMLIGRNIPKKNIILTVGRMIKSKRYDLLLHIFKKSNYQGWKLYFLGDGPERSSLEKLVKELHLFEYVVFLGRQQDVESYYHQAKIFAFTSNSEGFPNALGEAMRSGLAPISFKFMAGSTDLIEDGENGFLIPMDEEEEYVQKLNQLIQDDSLRKRFSKKAQQSCQAYDISIIGSEYYDFLLK